jgi:rod shape-determining protein MreC
MVDIRSGRRVAFFFFAAAFLLLFVGRWLGPVDSIALSAAAPFQGVVSRVANRVQDTVSGVFQGPRLRDENEKLKTQIGFLINQNLRLQQEMRDNTRLASLLKFTDANPHLDHVVSRVIGQDSNSLSPMILINKGTRDGMRKGLTVLDQHGYFVGTITSVDQLSAWVQLMLSPSSSVGAIDLETQAKGLVEGKFASTPVFDNVVVSSTIHPGDFIVTSGDYNLYPRTLLLGQVTSVIRRPFDMLQTARIQPAANFGDLAIVDVIRNWIPTQSNHVVTGP